MTQPNMSPQPSVTPPPTVMAQPDVRSFQVNIPQEDLDDLHQRIAASRQPVKELVADASQGAQLATLQARSRRARPDPSSGGFEIPHQDTRKEHYDA